MTEFLFPDNTVLCDFATVNRLDLLDSAGAGTDGVTERVRVNPA
jgi:hypothetical protein